MISLVTVLIDRPIEAKVARFAWEPEDFKSDSIISPGLENLLLASSQY